MTGISTDNGTFSRRSSRDWETDPHHVGPMSRCFAFQGNKRVVLLSPRKRISRIIGIGSPGYTAFVRVTRTFTRQFGDFASFQSHVKTNCAIKRIPREFPSFHCGASSEKRITKGMSLINERKIFANGGKHSCKNASCFHIDNAARSATISLELSISV